MLSIRKSLKTRIVGAIGIFATVSLMSIGAAAAASAGPSATGSTTTVAVSSDQAEKASPPAGAKLGFSSATAAGDYANCGDGYVCLYGQDQYWRESTPTSRWFQYGTYNLVNELGWHWIFNNQTDNAKLSLCTGYNGGGSCRGVDAGWALWTDFTPVNSIVVAP